MEVAGSISSGLKKQAIVAKYNGELIDLSRALQADGDLDILKEDAPEALSVLRHTTAHVLAQAVKRIYGQVQLGVGPVIDERFYYDMAIPNSLSTADLELVEREMQKIIMENLEIKPEIVSRKAAVEFFEEIGDDLKLELLADIPDDEPITVYRQGEYVDLCRGPHLPSTGKIKAFKLLSVAGAYWRGDSHNQMLQRVYGTAFFHRAELNTYLAMMAEAAKRDHRKLGQELDLFMLSEEAPGMPFYLPKGQTIRCELEAFSRALQVEKGYQEVRTPFMMNQCLWERSGHWDHYHENMYFTDVNDARFALKPMNCPGHYLIYKNRRHSYRDLPIRIAEFGQVHRHELSGALSGLTRVRTFCQDDAHLFIRPDQIETEVAAAFRLIDEMYRVFGFEYAVELSTRPEKSMGDDRLWAQAEGALRQVLASLGVAYKINEGDGAFYGPKIDFHIKDAIGRSHQCGTIQLDYLNAETFDLAYYDENNEKKRPVIIHRAIYGSIDRFFGILIEHFSGAFPTWLAPVQVKVIPVAPVHVDYADRVIEALNREGIRAELDQRNEKIGYKIREGQTQKIPYLLVVGDKEIEAGAVSVRKYGEQKSESIALDKFLKAIKKEIAIKAL